MSTPGTKLMRINVEDTCRRLSDLHSPNHHVRRERIENEAKK
jgi:hypothetical protein